MSRLQLRFLGDFEVRRNGKPVPLPPSKKTRALLAYLSLQNRSFRRERLCELLWEIPDDPRGSLRWSLSKLRRLIDDKAHARIIADRSSVHARIDDVSIDVLELRQLARNDLEGAALDTLEAAAAEYRGNFLEGLEFSNFHDFHSWCVAEREQALRDRAAVLSELVRRLGSDPERALPHARALVGLSPYDEAYRASLIRLLNAARQPAEAEEQYQLGLRMLKEAGVDSSGALLAARRAPRIDRTPAKPEPQQPNPEPRNRDRRVLFGREAEIDLITRTFENGVAHSRAGLMLLRGAPGIGKTRLMEHLRELSRDRDAFVLQARAFESDAIRPFALWIDALRTLGDGHVDAVFGSGEQGNRDRLFAALNDLAARESAERPVVLLFDDIHWCDESSSAVLHYILRMNRERPVLGVVAAREGELRDNTHMQQTLRGLRNDHVLTEIALEPLPLQAAKALISAVMPQADAERLSRECGGNPLLAIELARAEQRGGVSGSLGDLVQDWLARFGVDAAEILKWAVVMNPRIDVQTLARMTGVDEVQIGAVLAEAERHGMLSASGLGLRFAHDLIAGAVYSDISPLRRQVMHRRLAQQLEEKATPDLAHAAELAHHAAQSGDSALAARAMVSAGRLCLRFFANEDAQSLARKGLQLAESMPDAERVCLEIDLHDIMMAAGPLDDWEAAADKYAELAERALDHGALAHARLGYHMASWVRWAHGHWNAARQQTLQAVRAVRGSNDEAQIIGMAETASCLVLIERDLDQADALLMEARALADRRHFRHHSIAAGLGMLRYYENCMDDAEDLLQEARTLSKSSGDRLNEYQANEYLAMLYFQQGRLDEARIRAQQLQVLGAKLREGSEEPFARAMLALCAYAIDDDPAPLDEPVEDLRIADAKHRLTYVLLRAAIIDCERSRTGQGSHRAAEALGYAELLERRTEMLIANAVLAHCHAAAGQPQKAKKHRQEVMRLEAAGAAGWAGDIVERISVGAADTPARKSG